MNLRNFLTLTVRVRDFNLVAQQPELLQKLRELTLHHNSGLNFEMNRMLKDIKTRPVNCKVILAYRYRELVGWAILSNEDSNFYFFNSRSSFKKEDGWLFQVYVNPDHRRQGIASAILRKARKSIKNEKLCVCPWDDKSVAFYDKQPENLTKWL